MKLVHCDTCGRVMFETPAGGLGRCGECCRAIDAQAEHDPFAPPDVPILLHCLHCGRVLSSREMRQDENDLWRCGFEGCDGAGVGFDLHKIDSVHAWIVREGDGDELIEWGAAVRELLVRIGNVQELATDLKIMRANHPQWEVEVRRRFENPRLRADGTIRPT